MIAWLIYRKEDAHRNTTYINWLIAEALHENIELRLVYRENIQVGIEKNNDVLYIHGLLQNYPDFIIVRTIEPILQTQFEAMKIPVFNNSTVARICNDKAQSYIQMKQLQIPLASTYFLSKTTLPNNIPLSFPFDLKETTDRGGRGVYYISNEAEWNSVLHHIQTTNFIVQSAEHIQLGKDVRVFVIGKEIIAAVLRENSHDFRANYKLGGQASVFPLTPNMKKMIYNIIDHFDFGL